MRQWLHSFSDRLALAVFALAPVPFGSLEASWVVGWAALLGVSLATADLSGLNRRHVDSLVAIVLAATAYALAAFLQAGARPGLIEPIWERASGLLGEPLPVRVGATAADPLTSLGPAIVFVAALVRAFLLGAVQDGARRVHRTIAIAALAIAVVTGLALLVDPGMLLWRRKTAYLGNFTGSFVNRNTAAAFFAGAALLWALRLISRFRRDLGWRGGAREGLWLSLRHPRTRGRLLLDACGASVCLVAAAATGSRGGFIVGMLALGVAAVVYGGIRRRTGLRRVLLLGAVFVLADLIGGSVGSRLAGRGFDDVQRRAVYAAGLEMVAERPWLGFGLGSFEEVFPTYRPESLRISGVWDRVHSTPLEIAIEMGVPAAGAVVAAWLFLAARLLAAAVRRRRREIVAATAVGLLGAIHSCFDFSLQIPGYAITYAAIVGAGLGLLGRDPGQSRARSPAAGQSRSITSASEG